MSTNESNIESNNTNTKNNTTINNCPLCLDVLTFYTPRYPKMICQKCSNGDNGKILDSFGNEVSFGNIDISGGFISYHKINNNDNENNNKIIQKEDHMCWINNIQCYADEARFGGIVIQSKM